MRTHELTPERVERYDRAWLRAALTWGLSLSRDPECKLGAVVVSPDGLRCSFGYNGFPVHVPDTPENWADKELKNALVIHAEENALLNARFDTTDATVYCVRMPCHACLGRIANARADRVVWLRDDQMWKYLNVKAFDLTQTSAALRCAEYDWGETEDNIQRAFMTRVVRR